MACSIFCDLEKAFDSVNHDVLLSRLPYYGISGKAKLLLEFYLQNRYQRVHITNLYLNSNTVSKWTEIKYGVQQGSILGPLLFLVHINDNPGLWNVKLFLFYLLMIPVFYSQALKIYKCRAILILSLNN